MNCPVCVKEPMIALEFEAVEVDYCAFIGSAGGIPEEISWDGGDSVTW